MKRILFIAPHSFPIKSSESICNAKLAYNLAKAGYEVDVYACDSPSTYPNDNNLTKQLSSHPNLHIYTIKPDHIISRNASWRNILRSALYNLKILLTTGYFYNGISIPYQILHEILHIRERNEFKYDVLITRGFNTDLVGVELSKKFNIPWIANWNDPYPISKFPAPYGNGFDSKLPIFENRIYNDIQRYARLHTFPNERLRNYMLKCFKKINKEDTVIIPHMAMSTLFKKSTLNDGKLRFIHCGDLKSPRSPKNFLYALEAYLKKNPEKKDIIECYFIGGLDSDIPSLINDLDLSTNIICKKGLSYQDALTEISKCNISLIIEAQCDEGIYLPTKVVDSLQCGICLFAISPKRGVLRDLINHNNVGYYADNTSIDDIYSQIATIVDAFENNTLPNIGVSSYPAIYENEIINTYNEIINKRLKINH